MPDLATTLRQASENQALDIGTAWELLAQAADALEIGVMSDATTSTERGARALCRLYLHGDDPRFWGPQASSETLAYVRERLEREWPEFKRQAEVVIEAITEP